MSSQGVVLAVSCRGPGPDRPTWSALRARRAPPVPTLGGRQKGEDTPAWP